MSITRFLAAQVAAGAVVTVPQSARASLLDRLPGMSMFTSRPSQPLVLAEVDIEPARATASGNLSGFFDDAGATRFSPFRFIFWVFFPFFVFNFPPPPVSVFRCVYLLPVAMGHSGSWFLLSVRTDSFD